MKKSIIIAALAASSVASHAEMYLCRDHEGVQPEVIAWVYQSELAFRNQSGAVLEKLPANMSLDGRSVVHVHGDTMASFDVPTRTLMFRVGLPATVFVGSCREPRQAELETYIKGVNL